MFYNGAEYNSDKTTINKQEISYLFLAKEVSDLDPGVATVDRSVDRKVSVHKSHLVTIPLGDTSYKVLHVREGSTDRRHGAARTKPRIHLQLLTAFDQLEIEVEVLEAASQLATWPLDGHDLGVDLHGDPLGNVHGF